MGQYTTVTWQAGDEVTSTKLQQMCSNTEWLKDNIVLGNLNYIRNGDGNPPNGREAGIEPIKRIEALAVKFDSDIPKLYHDFGINIPSVFTEPPLIIPALWNWQNDIINVIDGTRPTRATFRVQDIHGRTVRHQGEMHVLFIGK